LCDKQHPLQVACRDFYALWWSMDGDIRKLLLFMLSTSLIALVLYYFIFIARAGR